MIICACIYNSIFLIVLSEKMLVFYLLLVCLLFHSWLPLWYLQTLLISISFILSILCIIISHPSSVRALCILQSSAVFPLIRTLSGRNLCGCRGFCVCKVISLPRVEPWVSFSALLFIYIHHIPLTRWMPLYTPHDLWIRWHYTLSHLWLTLSALVLQNGTSLCL